MASKNNRQTISKKLRFEIFKRDSFKCQYCGASAPDVVLQVDHIVPVKEGGKNDITNLITSCTACNSGKGATQLSDNSTVEKQRRQLEELNERREQLEMMMKWRSELASMDEDKLNYAVEKIENDADCRLTDYGINGIRLLVKKYPYDVLLDSIDASLSQYLVRNPDGNGFTPESRNKAIEYIGKICRMKILYKERPYLKDLYYLRAILRNRLNYCNEQEAFNYLERAYLAGYEIPELKTIVLSASSWTDFRNQIEDLLE